MGDPREPLGGGELTCRALKTKALYITGAEPDPGLAAVGVQCWCVHTMGTVGPDDGLVIPERCRAGRECFEAG